jgi:hypothetical protein
MLYQDPIEACTVVKWAASASESAGMPALSQSELDGLAYEVKFAFATVQAFHEALPSDLRRWVAEELPPNLEKSNLVKSVLDYANENMQIQALFRALHRCTSHRGLLELIKSKAWFVNEFRQRVADATVSLLPNKQPLVDRDYLRRRVREFLDPAGGPGRILVIPPSTAAGKSHSQHLFRHTAYVLDICFVFIDCLKERSSVEVAQKIANEIGVNSGYDELKKQIRDASRPGMVFKSWLKGRLPAPRRAWIVFDHVVKSAKEVESIALELAEAAALGEFETLYFTLIDSEYEPESAGFAGLGPLFRDNPVAALTPEDVASFMISWSEEKHKRLADDDATMEAQRTFQSLDLPPSRETTGKLIGLVGLRLRILGLLP